MWQPLAPAAKGLRQPRDIVPPPERQFGWTMVSVDAETPLLTDCTAVPVVPVAATVAMVPIGVICALTMSVKSLACLGLQGHRGLFPPESE